MPLTHVRTFRIRHHECDVYGYLHAADYLRYMQETAFDATSAAGYDMAAYEAMDRYWLIRETEIEHLRPLRYRDSIAVTTFVVDFRRIRSRRAYEFRLAGSDKVLARAQTDWVFLERSTGRPAPIPEALMAAFFPEGLPDPAPPRRRFPAAPPPPADAFRIRRPVQWQDLDGAHHVNNAVYLAYVEDAGLGATLAYGWTPARMADAGFALAGRQHRIEYLLPALLGGELRLTLWLSDVQATEVVRHATITRAGDGALLVRARTQWACVDPGTREPRLFPDAFLADLSPLMAAWER